MSSKKSRASALSPRCSGVGIGPAGWATVIGLSTVATRSDTSRVGRSGAGTCACTATGASAPAPIAAMTRRARIGAAETRIFQNLPRTFERPETRQQHAKSQHIVISNSCVSLGSRQRKARMPCRSSPCGTRCLVRTRSAGIDPASLVPRVARRTDRWASWKCHGRGPIEQPAGNRVRKPLSPAAQQHAAAETFTESLSRRHSPVMTRAHAVPHDQSSRLSPIGRRDHRARVDASRQGTVRRSRTGRRQPPSAVYGDSLHPTRIRQRAG